MEAGLGLRRAALRAAAIRPARRWRLLLAVALLLPLLADAAPLTANRVLVEKAARRLTLYHDGVAIASYRVALGPHPLGAKTRAGDGRTPEGLYAIDWRKADSGYHRALHVSYPNPADRKRAAAQGVAPGGDIMIHGMRNGLGWLGPLHRLFDWTRGCIALTDAEVDQVWQSVPDGTPVEIRP